MANQEISQFSSYADADDADLMPLVDISDTTDAGTGTTKKITRKDFLALITRTLSADGPAVAEDDIIFLNTASGTVTYSLLSAANRTRPLIIKNIGTAGNSGFIDPNSTETIDGNSANYELVDGDKIRIIPRTTTAWETL